MEQRRIGAVAVSAIGLGAMPLSVRGHPEQGDELRVSSKKRDDLQAVIALVKAADLDFAVQFVNYR